MIFLNLLEIQLYIVFIVILNIQSFEALYTYLTEWMHPGSEKDSNLNKPSRVYLILELVETNVDDTDVYTVTDCL